MKTFTEEQVLEILINMDIAINPEFYPAGRDKDLITEDFLDAAICNAQHLGLEDEFYAARKKAGNLNKQ